MRKWNGIFVVALVGQLALTTSAFAAPSWGEFRAGACVSMGKRLYSSVLEGIAYGVSWEETCAKTPATINGNQFDRPDKCVNTVVNIWGEFHVPDARCPVWGEARREFCLGSGMRQYSAILWDIPEGQSWARACEETPITINGAKLKAAKCVKGGFNFLGISSEYNMWGNFNVVDATCVPSEDAFVRAMAGKGFSDACVRANFRDSQTHWKTKGCSLMTSDDPVNRLYKDSFYPACVARDYCNTMPWERKDGGGRVNCDRIFLKEMFRICEGWGADRPGCDAMALLWGAEFHASPETDRALFRAERYRKENPLPECK